MVSIYVILVTVALGMVNAGRHDKYSRYSVHRVSPAVASHSWLVHALARQLRLDMWRHGLAGETDFLLMVPPEKVYSFVKHLDANGIRHSVRHPDVAKLLKHSDEQLVAWQRSRNFTAAPFDDYPRYAEVESYLERVANKYPGLVKLVNAGQSFEGRAVKYVKISTSNFKNASKPIFFMDATIHAREWVTTPVALHAVHRLVEDLRAEDRDLLQDIDWIILPVVNPDGLEYTHTEDRLWRKTRSYAPGISTCYGVDANRNFDYAFNSVGVSSDPCEDNYPGSEAFSEPEAAYVRDIMREYLDRIQLYLNIHSYGNTILTAYGDETLPPNSKEIFHVGLSMAAAIDARKLPEAPNYRVGNSATLHYPTSGAAPDYAQLIGVPLTFTLELPDYGYDFELPPRYIRQVTRETWEGLAVAARLARSYYEYNDRRGCPQRSSNGN